MARGEPASVQAGRRSAPGIREGTGPQSQPRLGETAIGQDTRQMKAWATAGAALALALLSFFQFPGHTYLQQDTQIYVPILEHLRDPSVLRNEILVAQPHVAFTIYD